jgi:hypothetical protein
MLEMVDKIEPALPAKLPTAPAPELIPPNKELKPLLTFEKRLLPPFDTPKRGILYK